MQSISVNVPWGHPADWQAREVLLHPGYFDTEKLQQLASKYRFSQEKIIEGTRGCVMWLLAETDEDVRWYRQ